jgi:hypothetical protein
MLKLLSAAERAAEFIDLIRANSAKDRPRSRARPLETISSGE